MLTCLSGCAAQGAPGTSTAGNVSQGQSSVAPARQGRAAESQRIQFIPEHLTLPEQATAAVFPAATVDGVLRVPEDVHHVGWWDGSARAGEPFGSTVIAESKAGSTFSQRESAFSAESLRSARSAAETGE